MSPVSDRLELIASIHGRSPLDLLELFTERAAIMQYCAGLSRADAESAALQDVERLLTEWSER